MRFFILLSMTFMLLPLFGQNLQSVYEQREALLRKEDAAIPKGGEPSGFIRDFYEKRSKRETGKAIKLRLIDERESLTGRHFLYRQYFDQWPLFEAELKVNTRGLSQLSSSLDLTFDLRGYALRDFKSEFGKSNAQALMSSYCSDPRKCRSDGEMLFADPLRKELIPALHFYVEGAGSYRELLLGLDGEVLIDRELSRRFAPDTSVRVLLFLPDPLTVAQKEYGGQFRDFNDQDNPFVNQQLREMRIAASYRNQVFRLEQPYVKARDIEGDSQLPPALAADDYRYTRGQAPFEMVHAYSHIVLFNEYIKSLGFGNATGFQLEVDGRGGPEDNSFFAPSEPPQIVFGLGNVDDAEDGEVVVHEYGHALSHWAAPNSNTGAERVPLDEGVCDYWAVSYSRQYSDYRWWDVFKWDGHNEFWPGRKANSTRHYPEDFDTSDIYASGEIWSAVLMEIYEGMGREACDRLVMEWIFGFSRNLSYQNAAGLLLITAEQLYGNDWQPLIFSRLLARGLLAGGETSINGSLEMQSGRGGLLLYINAIDPNARVEIYDLSGRQVFFMEGIGDAVMSIPASYFPVSGMYIIRLIIHPETENEEILVRKFIRLTD